MSKSKPIIDLMVAASLAIVGAAVSVPASAQVPAILPSVGDVEPSAPLPIDGMYNIREIHKRVVIENGYTYAIDSWIHAVVFQIMPNQVIMRDIKPLPDGSYISDNLPLMAKMKIEPMPGGSLLTRTVTGLPATYHLDPVGYGVDPHPPGEGWREDEGSHGDPDFGEEPVNPWSD